MAPAAGAQAPQQKHTQQSSGQHRAALWESSRDWAFCPWVREKTDPMEPGQDQRRQAGQAWAAPAFQGLGSRQRQA